jgi:hypothetical protein
VVKIWTPGKISFVKQSGLVRKYLLMSRGELDDRARAAERLE